LNQVFFFPASSASDDWVFSRLSLTIVFPFLPIRLVLFDLHAPIRSWLFPCFNYFNGAGPSFSFRFLFLNGKLFLSSLYLFLSLYRLTGRSSWLGFSLLFSPNATSSLSLLTSTLCCFSGGKEILCSLPRFQFLSVRLSSLLRTFFFYFRFFVSITPVCALSASLLLSSSLYVFMFSDPPMNLSPRVQLSLYLCPPFASLLFPAPPSPPSPFPHPLLLGLKLFSSPSPFSSSHYFEPFSSSASRDFNFSRDSTS